MGMCSHPPVKFFWQQILVIIGGPIASLIVGGIFLSIIIRGELSDNWIFVAAAFMLASVIDFLTNIYPSQNPLIFHDNSVGYSDGQQLKRLMARRGLPDDFFKAEKLFYEKKYDEADQICEQIIESGNRKIEVLRLATQILIEKKDYHGALERYGDLQGVKKLASEDFFTIGFLYQKLNQTETALKHLHQSIHLKYDNPMATNSRGEIFLQKGNLEFAERDFNAAIHYLPTFGTAYRNLGLLFIKKNQPDVAYENLMKAHEISSEDPFIFYGLGLFYEAKKDWSKALKNLKKAEAMNIETHVVRFKIAEIENRREE